MKRYKAYFQIVITIIITVNITFSLISEYRTRKDFIEFLENANSNMVIYVNGRKIANVRKIVNMLIKIRTWNPYPLTTTDTEYVILLNNNINKSITIILRQYKNRDDLYWVYIKNSNEKLNRIGMIMSKKIEFTYIR